jgi:hypothetical protein
MSEYENRYDDQEDDTNYAPYVVAGVGGAGGRLLARKLAGKGARVKIKGKVAGLVMLLAVPRPSRKAFETR